MSLAVLAAVAMVTGCGQQAPGQPGTMNQIPATGSRGAAFTDSAQASFTLEACRNNGDVFFPINGPFICADGNYTTGNLGKAWSELDLVPHRITTTLGNQTGATTTYNIYVAADYQTKDNAGIVRTGYDIISFPVVNAAKSDSSCTVTDGTDITGQNTQGTFTAPFGGGTDIVIYRELQIHQNKGTTCVFDWYQRLALGSHNYPGSSLQSYMFTGVGLSGSKKTISIPVPTTFQQIAKTMTAVQGSDHSWTVEKSSSPASLNFGDTCADGAPTSKTVDITVTWTRAAASPSGSVTVATTVVAANPAHRPITVNVNDSVMSGTTELYAIPLTGVVIAANQGSFTILSDTRAITAAQAVNLNDLATVTYIDPVVGDQPGTATATQTATVQLTGPENNQTATIYDTEHITGTGLTFSVDSTTGTYVTTGETYVHAATITTPADLLSALISPTSYTLGTATSDYVRWTSGTQTGSAYATFHKTVYRTSGFFNGSGTLSDQASLLGSSGFTTSSTVQNISIQSSPSVSLTINKTISSGVLTGSDTATFNFDICTSTTDPCNASSAVVSKSITFGASETSKSVTATGLSPGVYKVVERSTPGWTAAQPPNVDLSATCSGSASFTNNIAPAHAQVKKATVPTGGGAGWDFVLKGPGLPTAGVPVTTTADNTYISLGDLSQSGTYEVTETLKAGWDQGPVGVERGTTAITNLGTTTCKFIVTLPTDSGITYSCDFSNTHYGLVKVQKKVNGGAVSGSWTFSLYAGSAIPPTTTALETSTAITSGNPGEYQFTTHLAPGGAYTMCENSVPAGYKPVFTVGGVPTAPTQAGSAYCVNFTSVAGSDLVVAVDNTYGLAKVVKTVNGGAVAGTWNFSLKSGSTVLESGSINSSTAGGQLTFATLLFPGNTYTLCETGVPAGYQPVFTYNSSSSTPVPSGSDYCLDFTAVAGSTVEIDVNNTFSSMKVLKTVNGGTVTGSWTFKLYSGSTLLETSTAITSGNPGEYDFAAPLYPGNTYKLCEVNPAGYTPVFTVGTTPTTATASGSDLCVNFTAGAAGATVSITVDNTYSNVRVLKTYNGGAVNATYTFNLYAGSAIPPTTSVLESGTVSSGNPGEYDFAYKLVPGGSYVVCEMGVGAGTTPVFTPAATGPVAIGGDAGGDYCVAITAGAEGTMFDITVDNQHPNLGMRTIGYWKNWSTCGGNANVLQRAARSGNIMLDAVLQYLYAGTLGPPLSCQTAVSLLSKRDIVTGKNMASDPAYGLAAQLIAAEANVSPPVGAVCGTVTTVIGEAQTLLVGFGFNGTGSYKNKPGISEANRLAGILDSYNNGTCPSGI